MAEAMTLQTSSRYVGGATRKPMGRPFRSGIPTSAPAGKTVRALQKSTSRPAQSTSVTTTPTWASSLTLSTVGGFNAPLYATSGGSPRARCASLCAGRGPPAVLSGRRFGSVACGAHRLRGPQRLRALPSPPRHFKWGRGCGAARLGSAACGRRGFGIIFSYDTSGFHVCHLKVVTKKCQFGKNGDCISRKFCYNEIREFA